MSGPAPDIDVTHFRYSLLLREVEGMRAAAGAGRVALMLIRISGLDAVNDRFGYASGDGLLGDFASRLRGIARAQDRVFAVNSHTFAMLVRNPLHEGHVMLAANRVARSAAEPLVIGDGRATVKASIGVSMLPGPAASAEELVRQAECALAEARARDERHVLFAPTLRVAAGPQSPYTWFEIEEALRAGEFELFYQPKLALEDRRLVGAEALLRWMKPGVGCVPLAQFLPTIEHSRGVRTLLRFVLNAVLRQATAWSPRCPGFGVAVNLAAGNLEDPDLIELVDDALSVWGLPASQLTLELTESSLMQDPQASMQTMARLRGLGLHTSIDDFGTGYSSLAYLRDLPADELKVDRSFVSRIVGSAKDRDIVASIVQLAHAVQMQVVAEGIEEDATLAALTGMGCDIGQGYRFDRPLPVREFEERWIGAATAAASRAAAPVRVAGGASAGALLDDASPGGFA